MLSSAEAQRKATLERPPPVERSRTKDRAKSKGGSDKGGKGSDTAGKASKSESGSSDAAGAGLRDKSDNCAGWAASGECANNPAYMADECALSCKGQLPTQQAAKQESAREDTWTVDWPVPELQPDLARAMAESDPGRQPSGCEDLRDDCAELARSNMSGCGEAAVMLKDCRATCKMCRYAKLVDDVTGECADKHEQCAHWARIGECGKNKRFMLNGCSRSCEVCDAKRHGCSRRNARGGIVEGTGEGSMAHMFEQAMVDFPHFEPTALSRDPWVIQFENLLDPAEAEDMINRCRDFGKFERSQAGDQVSSVRTSSQCWCDDTNDCLKNPSIAAVTRRIMNVSRLPMENAEYFQILQYEPGQFYRQHHDQQTAFWTPQGVRLYTFFVYLSDVEEGGGTKFNDLGITVTPKLGRGILWPSVYTDDHTKGDMRTHHEALPVVKGIKHAANLWQHLYDFKGPSRSGLCPFLGQNTNP
tara:strand:+ start:1425 stop:2846 length:1422 start_codon:yes stop_codon:yes gene_type:complete